MGTHRSSWKRRERNGAALFGTKRQVLSGSSGRDDRSRSDSVHPRLFIETKYRAASATRALWEKTNKLSQREGKTPVVLLYDKGKAGALIVVYQDHLAQVAAELACVPGYVQQSAALPANPHPTNAPDEIADRLTGTN